MNEGGVSPCWGSVINSCCIRDSPRRFRLPLPKDLIISLTKSPGREKNLSPVVHGNKIEFLRVLELRLQGKLLFVRASVSSYLAPALYLYILNTKLI